MFAACNTCCCNRFLFLSTALVSRHLLLLFLSIFLLFLLLLLLLLLFVVVVVVGSCCRYTNDVALTTKVRYGLKDTRTERYALHWGSIALLSWKPDCGESSYRNEPKDTNSKLSDFTEWNSRLLSRRRRRRQQRCPRTLNTLGSREDSGVGVDFPVFAANSVRVWFLAKRRKIISKRSSLRVFVFLQKWS